MACEETVIANLPDTFAGCTWDGLTWTVSEVDGDDTEFADTLASATLDFKDANGNTVLSLSSAVSGELTINVATANAWSVTAEPRILSIDDGTYSWALKTIDSAGVKKVPIGGSIRVKPEP